MKWNLFKNKLENRSRIELNRRIFSKYLHPRCIKKEYRQTNNFVVVFSFIMEVFESLISKNIYTDNNIYYGLKYIYAITNRHDLQAMLSLGKEYFIHFKILYRENKQQQNIYYTKQYQLSKIASYNTATNSDSDEMV